MELDLHADSSESVIPQVNICLEYSKLQILSW